MSTFRFSRRLCLTMATAGLSVLWSSSPQAQTTWPSRSVTIVVPFAPGGGTDIGTRIVAQRLSQPVSYTHLTLPTILLV